MQAQCIKNQSHKTTGRRKKPKCGGFSPTSYVSRHNVKWKLRKQTNPINWQKLTSTTTPSVPKKEK